jgi:hypothetical protein
MKKYFGREEVQAKGWGSQGPLLFRCFLNFLDFLKNLLKIFRKMIKERVW